MLIDGIAVFIAQYFYFLVLLIGLIFFFIQPWNIKKSMMIRSAIIGPLAYLLSRIAGLLYYDPRPFVVGHFVPLIAHAADNGFPSDHVLLTGAAAMVIWFYDKKWSAVLWALALLIGWARVYSGVHHAVDIMGSIVIVLFSGSAYYYVSTFLWPTRGRVQK